MSSKKIEKKLKEITNQAYDIVEKTNDLPQAISFLESYMQEFKDNQLYLEELAGLCYENYELEKSLQLFEKAFQKSPSLKTRSLLCLANLYNDQRSLSLYQNALAKLIVKNKDIFSQETNRMISKICLQQMLLNQNLRIQQDALSAMKEIRTRDPYYLEILYYMFLFYLNQEDEKSSLEVIREFVQLLKYLQDKNTEEITIYDKDFYLQIVDILLEGNYFSDALQILQVVQEIIVSDVHIMYLIAFCLYQMEQADALSEVLKEIDQLIQENPQEHKEIATAVKDLKGCKKANEKQILFINLIYQENMEIFKNRVKSIFNL